MNACLDSWFRKISFGMYHVTNPGFVCTAQVLDMIETILKLDREFTFWEGAEYFYRAGATRPRSNCIMESSKLLSAWISEKQYLPQVVLAISKRV